MRRIARSFPLVAASVLLVTGAGCGKAAEKVSEKVAEKAIEDATGGKGDVDISADGGVRIETEEGVYRSDGEGNVLIETEDGTYRAGSTELPDRWPSDVALPGDLEITTTSDLSNGTESMVMVAGSTAATPDEVVAALEERSGWTASDTFRSSGNGMTGITTQLEDGERKVQVTANRMDGESTTNVSFTYIEPAGS